MWFFTHVKTLIFKHWCAHTTHTVCADRHTFLHCRAVSSLGPLLPWTRTSPPGPQPEPAGAHLPRLAAWPSCSGGHKPESKHNSSNWLRNKLLNQGNTHESLQWTHQVGGNSSYFSIVYLKEADVDREIQIWKPPVVEECKNLLGLRRKDKSIDWIAP